MALLSPLVPHGPVLPIESPWICYPQNIPMLRVPQDRIMERSPWSFYPESVPVFLSPPKVPLILSQKVPMALPPSRSMDPPPTEESPQP